VLFPIAMQGFIKFPMKFVLSLKEDGYFDPDRNDATSALL